ncbi:MAG: aminotransferase class V-fold PLP-dependent enzyme [Bacteroidetes bacterium]|nr:aminotransferase class V-fold PLP-dependent enzyme [Bacteroidota bacterium]
MNENFDFLVRKDITFLNFGSFGSCPKEIFSFYQGKQLELESQPVYFIVEEGIHQLNNARKSLSQYVNCDHDDLVFVTNPSYAINTIAKSLPLNKGDEVLSTNLEYGALIRTWNYYCEKKGAKFVQQSIPLPLSTVEEVVDAFFSGCNKNTKAIFISQITSSTALILPVAEICIEAKKRGLLTIVDGAHVPAHIALNLHELKADIYTGACHKWMMAPKGASFLFASKNVQEWIDPLLISWGFQTENPSSSRFIDYHQTAGTRDFSAFLTVPFCIDFMKRHDWEKVSRINKEMTIEWANRLKDRLKFKSISPIDDTFLGQMFAIPIQTTDSLKLKEILWVKFKIEIPVTQMGNRNFIRFSIQAFNDWDDYAALETALIDLQKSEIIKFC